MMLILIKKSVFIQTIRLYSGIDLIDYTLDLDFNEKKSMIKLTFPLNLETEVFNSERYEMERFFLFN